MTALTFVNTLVFVADMRRSLGLYRDLLGQKVAQDHGQFVKLETGLALHEGTSLERTIFGPDHAPSAGNYGRCNLMLYFEVEDLDSVFARLSAQVQLVHPIRTQSWGQRVFRFEDPDGHLVEIGEPL